MSTETPIENGPGKFAYEFFELDGVSNLKSLARAGFDADGDNAREADATGTTDVIDVDAIAVAHGVNGSKETFGIKYTTELAIEEGGSYTFALASDDGSKMFIDGNLVVNNDGHHSVITRYGSVELDRGVHEIEIIFYENRGAEYMAARFGGPDTGGQMIDLSSGNIGIDVEPAPTIDLSFAAFDVTRDEDGGFTVEMTVQNTGDSDANGVSSTIYWSPTAEFDMDTAVVIDRDGHADLTAGEVDSDETEGLRLETLQKLGSGYVFGMIDAADEFAESNEGNNLSQGVAITVAQPDPETPDAPATDGADLRIVHLSAEDRSLKEGQDLRLTLGVKNGGDEKAHDVSTSFYWSATDTLDMDTAILVGDDRQGNMRIGEVDMDAGIRLRYEDLVEHGDGYVFAVVDAADDIAETDETNNVSAGLRITVAAESVEPELPEVEAEEPEGLADFAAGRLSIADRYLARGEDLELDFTVSNIGSDDGRADARIYWSATNTFDAETAVEIGDVNYGRLREGDTESGRSVTVDHDVMSELGTGFIFGVVDAENETDESDEGNNVSAAVRVVVQETPIEDMRLVNSHIQGRGRDGIADMEEGEDMFLFATMVNRGFEDARGVEAGVYWSADATFDAAEDELIHIERIGKVDAREVLRGEEIHVHHKDFEDLGDGYMFILIDPNGELTEQSTANNLSAAMAFEMV